MGGQERAEEFTSDKLIGDRGGRGDEQLRKNVRMKGRRKGRRNKREEEERRRQKKGK